MGRLDMLVPSVGLQFPSMKKSFESTDIKLARASLAEMQEKQREQFCWPAVNITLFSVWMYVSVTEATLVAMLKSEL